MSSIIHTLNENLHWHQQNGLQPSRVYLGHIEHTELREFARQFRVVENSKPWNDVQRITWNGVEVFEVDAKTHFSFNTEAPSPCG